MDMEKAKKALTRDDPVMAELIKTHGVVILPPPKSYYESLAEAIIGQQISVKAADKIFERFRSVTRLKPDRAQKLSESQVKEIGLSGQKTRYLQDLAGHFVRDSAVFDHLDSLSDDEVIQELTRVKGIGVWTAQMFLIFTLQRADVFSQDDRGLQLAVERLYEVSLSRSELEAFASRWAPYRSVACIYLWQSQDNKPSSAPSA